MKMEKSKNYGGCLADIHTLLHMPVELFRHAGNNNAKADTNTEQLLKQVVDFAERLIRLGVYSLSAKKSTFFNRWDELASYPKH